MPKNILMLAQNKKCEALRMATGLTLLDDQVSVAVIGDLDRDDEEVSLQLESLDFADVPVIQIDPGSAVDLNRLAESLGHADAVFVV